MSSDPVNSRLSVTGMEVVTGGCAGLHDLDRMLVKAEPETCEIELAIRQLRNTRVTFGSAIRRLDGSGKGPENINRDRLLRYVIEGAMSDMAASVNSKELALVVVQKEHHDPVASDVTRPFSFFQTFASLGSAIADIPSILEHGVKGVVVAAAELLGPGYEKFAESKRVHPGRGSKTLLFAGETTGVAAGEAGTAMVFMRGIEAGSQNIYATIDALETGPAKRAQVFMDCCASEAEQPALFYSSAFNEATTRLESGLLKSCFPGKGGYDLALHGIVPLAGYCGSAHSSLSMVCAILSCYHRVVPAVPAWTEPSSVYGINSSAAYFPEFSRQWFVTEEHPHRHAVISLCEGDTYTAMAITDREAALHRPNRFLKTSACHIFPLHAESWDSLLREILDLRATAKRENSLRDLSGFYLSNLSHQSVASYRAVVIAEDAADLEKELELMEGGIAKVASDGGEFKTPKGSYVTATPLATGESAVSMVFPGAGSSYIGIGAEIFHLFPSVYEMAEQQSRDVGKVMKEEVIYPRTQKALNFREKKQREMMFQVDLPSITETDTVYSWICTRIVKDVFGIEPAMAIGYSLGEANMFFSLEVWDEPLEMKKKGDSSPIFRKELRADFLSIRRQWGIDESVPSSEIWDTHTFKAEVEDVRAAVNEEDKVFLSMINTNDSVVIAGEPEGCKRVIEKLGVRSIRMGFVPALHVEPAYEQYEEIAQLYHHPVSSASQDAKMYSTSCYLPIPQRSKSIAYAIAKCFCDPVDFPRLVNKVYEDGARIFIEAGAGRSCSTWIDKILQGKDHLCVPLNAKGTDDQLTLARAMAKLFCNGVDVDFSSFHMPVKNTGNITGDEEKRLHAAK